MNTFQQNILPVLLALAPYLVPPIIALVGALLARFIQNLPAQQQQNLSWIVTTAVNAVEQSSGSASLSDSQKKALAIQQIDAMLAHFHLTIPMSVIDPMVEQAVLLLNMAQGKGDAKAPTPLALDQQPTVVAPKVTSKEGAA